MPDFFAPHDPVDVTNVRTTCASAAMAHARATQFPPTTAEGKAALGAFFGGPAAPSRVLPMVKAVAQALKAGGATQVGVYGYCWGAFACGARRLI